VELYLYCLHTASCIGGQHKDIAFGQLIYSATLVQFLHSDLGEGSALTSISFTLVKEFRQGGLDAGPS